MPDLPKDWNVEEVLDPKTGEPHNKYFYKGQRAQRIPITSERGKALAAYALIERDLRMVREWIIRLDELNKPEISEGKEGYRITAKSDAENNLAQGLFVAAVTFYGKCFSQAEGRRQKLEKKDVVPKELTDIHEKIMGFRNNFTAHSGIKKAESAHTVLVLCPDRPVDRAEQKFLWRELVQAESWILLDDKGETFLGLVDAVKAAVLKKIDALNDKIFAEEINPHGLDYWYSKEEF